MPQRRPGQNRLLYEMPAAQLFKPCGNSVFYDKQAAKHPEYTMRTEPPESKYRITWNIHWNCNFRCSYCFFDGHWQEYARRNVYKTVREWMTYWKRMRDKYGRIFITITGGEPFIYPDFTELIRQLSAIHWPINITTNFSRDLQEFVKSVDYEKVSLSVSFHPQYHQIDSFIGKVKWLRSNKFAGCNNFVAYPPFMSDLQFYAGKFASIGENLKVVPFIGKHGGKNYPDGYDDAQKRMMGMKEDWLEHKRHKGMVCQAGSFSALLTPEGNVVRCGQIGDRHILGSFFAPDFELSKEPMPCDAEFCPCDEWKVMPDEKPSGKTGIWIS